MTNRRRTVAALVLSGALVSGLAGAASAQETETETVPAERLEAACARVPLIRDRIERVLARWEGDADTRGSRAWLEERADKLREQGRTEAAEVVEATIEVRTERLDVLEARLVRLDEIDDVCAEEGL